MIFGGQTKTQTKKSCWQKPEKHFSARLGSQWNTAEEFLLADSS